LKIILIGLDASRGFLKNRTGVEEYSYQITKALIKIDQKNQYILYLNGDENLEVASEIFWPDNFKLKNIPLQRAWVHLRLCRAARRDRVNALFIPSQAMPVFYPGKTVVTLHGLEYEHYPKSYSAWRKFYLRQTTKFSLKAAAKIIAVSENTKKDLVKMYNGDAEKIRVVHHGYNAQLFPSALRGGDLKGADCKYVGNKQHWQAQEPFFLAIGRLETRKNILNLIKAFELLKKDGWGGKLVLVGKPGYGYEKIKKALEESPNKKDIIEKGFVSENEKWQLLRSAAVFVFPSFYEGFGMPLLEAFSAGAPVICSNASSLPEVGEDACLYFDPNDVREISQKIKQVLDNDILRQDLIAKGQIRLRNFSWEKCGRETLEVLEEAAK